MEPIVHGLEDEYGNEIDFVYVDIDDPASQAIEEQYNQRGQPYFVLVDAEGEVVMHWFGAVESAAFESAFENVLN